MQMNSPLCNSSATGAASAIVQGGIPGYTYHWSPVGEAVRWLLLYPQGLTLTVRDTNGCVHMDSVTVGEPDALLLTAEAEPVSCFGAASGSVEVQADGGTPAYTYLYGHRTGYRAGKWTRYRYF
ncbi:MAG: SprB repeat-containing protein [Bacteroidia bacterium]